MSAGKPTEAKIKPIADASANVSVPGGDLAPWDHDAVPPGLEGAEILASLVDPHDYRRRMKLAELRVKWMQALTEDAVHQLAAIGTQMRDAATEGGRADATAAPAQIAKS